MQLTGQLVDCLGITLPISLFINVKLKYRPSRFPTNLEARGVPMTIDDQKGVGFITLKQASELFGYAPDYIGQLIRQGKIEGKQVHANIAWMTTVSAVENYLGKEKKSSKTEVRERTLTDRFARALFSEQSISVFIWFFRILLILFGAASILIFYFLSVSIDRTMIERTEKGLSQKVISTPPALDASLIEVSPQHI